MTFLSKLAYIYIRLYGPPPHVTNIRVGLEVGIKLCSTQATSIVVQSVDYSATLPVRLG